MLLEVNNLSVSYPEFTLHPVSFALDAGEMLTIVGESGSGKTTLARAIACLSEPEAQVSGQVYLNGRELLAMDERARRPLRMKEFALSFQNSAEWLNPSLTLAEHLREVLCRAYRGAAMAARMEELMALVGLETADLERYPRELSGGMVQKFLLANALALNPALVLLDEPTGALDIASSRGITALIQELNRRLGTAFLVITHDMKLAADLGGRTVVLYDGHVEEAGDTRALLDHPRHPYTRGLLQSAVGLNPVRDMWGIRPTTVSYTRQPHGCPFYGRCTQSLPDCAAHAPGWYSSSGAGTTPRPRPLAGLPPRVGDGGVEYQGEQPRQGRAVQAGREPPVRGQGGDGAAGSQQQDTLLHLKTPPPGRPPCAPPRPGGPPGPDARRPVPRRPGTGTPGCRT